MRRFWAMGLAMLLAAAFLLTGCAPAAAPAPPPTSTAAAPTKAAEAATPPAPATAAATTAPAVTPTNPAATSAAPTTAAAPSKQVTLKFGSIQSISDAGIYVALDKGYFQEQGITMDITNFRNASEGVPALATGQIDVLSTPLSAALLAAADRGVDLKIVADKGQSLPKWEFAWIVLRKDLADSGQVKTPADLKGMKVAIPSQGSLGDQTVQMMLDQAGFKPGDVDVEVVSQADQAAAFGNKAIAAGYTVDPYIAKGVQDGFSVKWIPNSQLFGGRVQVANVIFGSALLKDQDLAQRWMVAYVKGIRDYIKAFTTQENRDEIVKILAKYSTVKDLNLYNVMEMPYLDPNGMPDTKSMDEEYKFFVDKGVYKGTKTFSDIMDLSYAEYAAQKLGKQ